MVKGYKPRYVHIYEVSPEYIGLFNAITLEVVYCRKNLLVLEDGKIATDTKIADIITRAGMAVESELQAHQKIMFNIEKYSRSCAINTIRFLYIVPTVSCNLSCTYCHIQHGKMNREKFVMTEDTLRRGLDIFARYGGFDDNDSEIMFYGGEPLLEAQFVIEALKIIRSYSETIKITFFTNGTLITDEIAISLKKYGVYVIVSLDGSEEAHNAARIYHNGGGSYEDAINGYMRLRENGISVGISLVAGIHNINKLEEYVLYLAETFQPLDIGISTLHLFKDGSNPNEVDMSVLIEKLQLVQTNMKDRGVYIEHLFRKIRPFVEKHVRLYDCPSCNSKLLITPWDTIGFCEAFMEDESYFYSTDSFDLTACPGRADWKQRTPLIMTECYSCPAISICGGGCPYDAYCESGSVCNRDQRRCYQSIEMIRWLCESLFHSVTQNHKINHQDIYQPSIEERKLLYGNVILDDNIPLQNYSKLNEASEDTGLTKQ